MNTYDSDIIHILNHKIIQSLPQKIIKSFIKLVFYKAKSADEYSS